MDIVANAIEVSILFSILDRYLQLSDIHYDFFIISLKIIIKYRNIIFEMNYYNVIRILLNVKFTFNINE